MWERRSSLSLPVGGELGREPISLPVPKPTTQASPGEVTSGSIPACGTLWLRDGETLLLMFNQLALT